MPLIPAPELPAGPRSALLIGVGTFASDQLPDLKGPPRDVATLGNVLRDPQLGRFDVTEQLNLSAHDMRTCLQRFLRGQRHDGLALVYLSCHGVLDEHGALYFSATDTDCDLLAATALGANWLRDLLQDCVAESQVLLLDCCFAGAFSGIRATKDLGLPLRLIGSDPSTPTGRGRVVLSASRGSEPAYEDTVADAVGVFTAALVEGLRTGLADVDGDGMVSVEDAYFYTEKVLRQRKASQTPQRSMTGGEGKIFLTRSPREVDIAPAPLPESIRIGLEASGPGQRLGAVNDLAEWLTDSDPARKAAAREALQKVADKDHPDIATAARGHLDRLHETPAPPDHTTESATGTASSVSFNATVTTWHGQNVYVTGSIPALGIWNTANAIALSPTAYPIWSATAAIPQNTAFEYKYFKKNADGSIDWESGPNRTSTGTGPTAASGSVTLHDAWNTAPGTAMVRVTFNETKRTGAGQSVYVVGDISELGSWDPARAVPLSSSARLVWSGTVSIPQSVSFEYKYLVKDGSGYVTWEDGSNRSAGSGAGASLTINDTWK